MDIGTKERLTGALILVALVVLLVPPILMGPAERDPREGQAADGPPLRSYSMDLGADASHSVPDQSALAPQNAQAPESEVVTAEPPAAPPAETPGPPPPQVGQPAPAQEQTAPTPGKAAAPAIKPAAPAATKPAPAVVEQPVPAGSWWVQIGSFSQSANAQRLVQQLSAKGFRARVSPVTAKGKELFRVRAGPVGDRASAEALQARLAAAGHKGSLVAP